MKKLIMLIPLLLLPIIVYANTSGTLGNVNWTYEGGTLTLSGNGRMPFTYSDHYTPPWNDYKQSIRNIVIKAGVTYIADYAFSNCSAVTSITVEAGNTYYDSRENCNAIINTVNNSLVVGCQNTLIPVNVTSIEAYAFSGRSSLTSISIPDGVTHIDYRAFMDCSALTSINIPNSVTNIGQSAFDGCSALTSINIPNSVIDIGKYAFRGCSALTSIAVEPGNLKYDSRNNCNAIIETETNTLLLGCPNTLIPNSVTSIGSYAFYGLRSIIIPSGVISIADNAFGNKNITKTIWLTNSPPIGYKEAEGLVNYVSNDLYTSLDNKVVYPFLSSLFDVNGVRYVPVSPSDHTCDAIDCIDTDIEPTVKIPSAISYQGINMTIKNIQPYFCRGSNNIKYLICENEGNIAQYAFSGCPNLENAICNNIGSIGESAFYNCKSLRQVSLGEKTTNIGSYAFENCTYLSSIEIPNDVTGLGWRSFAYCSSLERVIIGTNVKTIGSSSFLGCYSLSTITIGSQVVSIGYGCFENCKNLSTISLPKSILNIYNNAFNGCIGLKNVYIEDREEELNMGYITNQNGGYGAPLFYDCPLDSVYIGGNITYKNSSDYGYSPFYGHPTLRTVAITGNETEISQNEFYGCTNLQSFTVGDGVTKFGDWAFSGCSSLKNLSFGSQLQTIGKDAFSDCTSVTKIVSKTATPPACGDQALDDINKWSCTLVVPTGSKEAYQAANQWKEFFFIEEGEGGGNPEPINPETKKCAKPTIYYSNGKLTFESATAGAICESTITDADINSYTGNEVQLGVTYRITVKATRDGYEDSDIATATLCWIEVEPLTEGIANDEVSVSEVKAMPVLIQADGRIIVITGAADGTPISVFSINGMQAGSAISQNGKTTIPVQLPGNIAIVKIGDRSVKVMVK